MIALYEDDCQQDEDEGEGEHERSGHIGHLETAWIGVIRPGFVFVHDGLDTLRPQARDEWRAID